MNPSKQEELKAKLNSIVIAEFEIEPLLALIHSETVAARADEAREAAHAWNISKSTESFADEMNDRIRELETLGGEK